MQWKPFERIEFQQILEILEPDLTAEFKIRSYYNNAFKIKKQKILDEINCQKNVDSNYANESIYSNSTFKTEMTTVSEKVVTVPLEMIPLIDEEEKLPFKM